MVTDKRPRRRTRMTVADKGDKGQATRTLAGTRKVRFSYPTSKQ